MATTTISVPDIATDAVLVKSEAMPENSQKVTGYDFNKGIDHHALLQSFTNSGFQATNFGLAVEQINAMVRHDLSHNQLTDNLIYFLVF